jgi:hypothetical protein
MPRDPPHACFLAYCGQSAVQALLIERLAVRVNEHVSCAFLSLVEHFIDIEVERNMPFTVAFWSRERLCVVTPGMPHRQAPSLPINGGPLHSLEFALSHTRTKPGECHLVNNAIRYETAVIGIPPAKGSRRESKCIWAI